MSIFCPPVDTEDLCDNFLLLCLRFSGVWSLAFKVTKVN